jgi:hypothetical protein
MMSQLSADQAMALTLINALVCACIAWVCICRLRVMNTKSTSNYFRTSYAMTLTMSIASGASFWLFGEQAGPGQLGLACAVVVWIGGGMQNWARGTPWYARPKNNRGPEKMEADSLNSVPGGTKESGDDGVRRYR